MKRNVSRIFKQEDFINVYQTVDSPDIVYKEHMFVSNRIATIEELKEKRKKLLAMKNRKEWPEFLIRPNVVERFNKYSFTAGYPFVKGADLKTYLSLKDVDLHTCAKFIKKVEDNIYKEKDFVFPDLANRGNIIILQNENTDDIDFKLIDSDDVQFDGYGGTYISCLIYPCFFEDELIKGIKKCRDGDMYNKQLDIRSIYALLYCMLNGYDLFYPCFVERKSTNDYEKILNELNIPTNSSLYEKTMKTIDEKKPNEAIGDSLYELIECGYELETYDIDCFGYKHRLIKK